MANLCVTAPAEHIDFFTRKVQDRFREILGEIDADLKDAKVVLKLESGESTDRVGYLISGTSLENENVEVLVISFLAAIKKEEISGDPSRMHKTVVNVNFDIDGNRLLAVAMSVFICPEL